MASGKGKQATLGEGRTYGDEFDAPPSYESSQPGPSTAVELSAEPLTRGEKPGQSAGPTVDSPFNFPSNIPSPAYSPPASSNATGPSTYASRDSTLPIAIPQIRADGAAPFLLAYHPTLLSHGIPPSSWVSFLHTLSAFLSARVSERALSHAADVGRHIGSVPKNFGKGTLDHVREVGRSISKDTKSGNLVGAGFAAIGGAISIPVGTAFRAVGAVVALPFAAASAVGRRPLTPRDRAAAYLAVANRDWFRQRGLRARILDTRALAAEALRGGGVPPQALLDAAQRVAAKGGGVAEQLLALDEHIERLEILNPEAAAATEATLDLGTKSLWLVMVPAGGEDGDEEEEGDDEVDDEEYNGREEKGQKKERKRKEGKNKGKSKS